MATSAQSFGRPAASWGAIVSTRGARRLTSASMRGSRSIAITRPLSPTSSAAGAAKKPGPQPKSTTFEPTATPASASSSRGRVARSRAGSSIEAIQAAS